MIALVAEDIEPVAGGIYVHIRKSKTDQEGACQTIAVSDRVSHPPRGGCGRG